VFYRNVSLLKPFCSPICPKTLIKRNAGWVFRAKTFTPQEVNASCFGYSCQARLKQGISGTRGLFPQGIFDLHTQAQKFSVSPFTKGDDLRRFLKAAVGG
jgi:hypothetical protein